MKRHRLVIASAAGLALLVCAVALAQPVVAEMKIKLHESWMEFVYDVTPGSAGDAIVQRTDGGNTRVIFGGDVRVCDTVAGCPTVNVATADGELFVEGDIETDGNLNVAGDIAMNGGTGAFSFAGFVGSSTVLMDDNNATSLSIGSTGRLDLLTFDTVNDTETVVVTGTTATTAFHVDVGEALFDEGVDMAIAATTLQVIRFCGNGSATGAAHYMGPVLLDDTEADLVFGGAGCDALDSATEATADAPWHAAFAFRPVSMVCVGVCTGATAANDAITYQLRDDAADVTGMTCTAAAWSGDATPSQCTVRDASPATVAAGSTVAIRFTGTDDACEAAGDDFECLVWATF